MGVSGSGKTTIGKLLAESLGLPFIDADDYHPESNIEKMRNNIALTDEDRKPWLITLNILARTEFTEGGVIACSALKEVYRHLLADKLNGKASWVYLQGTYLEIHERLSNRSGHFMKSAMLKSQFDVLEEPKEALQIRVTQSPTAIVEQIVAELK